MNESDSVLNDSAGRREKCYIDKCWDKKKKSWSKEIQEELLGRQKVFLKRGGLRTSLRFERVQNT